MMAGGDVRGGQAIGATDTTASAPLGGLITPDDLAASFYANIGVDPKTEFPSDVGRPMILVRDGRPIRGLLSL